MSARKKKEIVLGAHFQPLGHHVAAWLHPETYRNGLVSFPNYAELAQIAERGKFDLIFLADGVVVREGNMNGLSRWPSYMAYFEPLTLLSALSVVTKHIGLVATASTSYSEPYNVARMYASLDHISAGRAGWNAVTTSNPYASRNFGLTENPGHGVRYERAREFIQAVRGLWDSWDDDAFIADHDTGVYFRPDALHKLNFEGKHLSVRGPLNVPRSPQGHPIVSQAGSSAPGMELAAETADLVFVQERSRENAQVFYADFKARLGKYGRDENDVKIMAGFSVVVAESQNEADEQQELLQSLVHPDVGRELLSAEIGGFDLSNIPDDKILTTDMIPATTNAGQTTLQRLRSLIESEPMTLREVYLRYTGARGSFRIVGTPQRVVDEIESWFTSNAADGFIFQATHFPGGLNNFVNLVIPELQRRGLFRKEYRGRTLRENLGLKAVKSRYQSAPA